MTYVTEGSQPRRRIVLSSTANLEHVATCSRLVSGSYLSKPSLHLDQVMLQIMTVRPHNRNRVFSFSRTILEWEQGQALLGESRVWGMTRKSNIFGRKTFWTRRLWIWTLQPKLGSCLANFFASLDNFSCFPASCLAKHKAAIFFPDKAAGVCQCKDASKYLRQCRGSGAVLINVADF